jgi:hypothetical protein
MRNAPLPHWRRPTRRMGRVAALLTLLGLIAATAASGLHLRAGNIVIDGDGGFAPKALPRDHMAPIKFFMHGRISTVDGSRPEPLRRLVLELDRHGAPETRGLPKCSWGKLVATTTKQARQLCPGAIIGTGFGTAVVELPEQAPIEASSPLTVFNGPEKHGNPTAIGHAHLDYPSPTTYLVQSEIQKVDHGRYGYKLVFDFPKIVNDYGSGVYARVRIDRKWNYRGRTLSIANARCADGRLQARVEATFKDGTRLAGTAFKPCEVRPEG